MLNLPIPNNCPSADITVQHFDIFDTIITQSQKTKIEENIEKSECPDIQTYLKHVALHGVISAVVEVRSTGTLDAMLARIATKRNISIPDREV